MAQKTLPKSVENTALVELNASLIDFDTKRATLTNRQNRPQTFLPRAIHEAVDEYYKAFEKVKEAVVKALPTLLETARTSSPYYGLPQEVRDKAYKDFMTDDKRVTIEFESRFSAYFVVKCPNSEYNMCVTNSGEGGPNLVDEKKKVYLTVEFELKKSR